MRASVDLPEPNSPTMPSVSPAASSKLTPSTARTTSPVRRRIMPERDLVVLGEIAHLRSGGSSGAALAGARLKLGRGAARPGIAAIRRRV